MGNCDGEIIKNSQNLAKYKEKLVFRPPFFAEKRKIEKKRKRKILRFGGTHNQKVPRNITM